MEIYQGKMSDVLVNCRDVLRNNVTRFGKAHPDFFKVGFLGQSPIYPAIAVMPSSQVIVQTKSNREYLVSREVAIQVYDIGASRAEAESAIQRHLDILGDILRRDREYFLKDSNERSIAYNFDWGSQNINPMPFALPSGGFVMEALVILTFFSKWWRPTRKVKSSNYTYVSEEEAYGRVFNKLDNQRRGGALSQLGVLAQAQGVPRDVGFTGSLRIATRNPERYAAGMDLTNMQYEFIVYSKMLPDEQSLIGNCDLVEAAWEIVDQDETFGGAFYDSNFDSIQWREKQFVKEGPPFYETAFMFTCSMPKLTLEGTQT